MELVLLYSDDIHMCLGKPGDELSYLWTEARRVPHHDGEETSPCTVAAGGVPRSPIIQQAEPRDERLLACRWA